MVVILPRITSIMILYKLKELECGLDPHNPEDAERMEVVRGLLALMLQIDHDSETLLDDSAEKLSTVLSFIQQTPLSDIQKREIFQLMMR